MKLISLRVISIILLTSLIEADDFSTSLIEKINTLRIEHSLSPLTTSSKLTQTASAHVKNLNQNPSIPPGSLDWGGELLCSVSTSYNCTWNKPLELANYENKGYEITFDGSLGVEALFNEWKEEVNPIFNFLLNREAYSGNQWKVIGVAKEENYGSLWMGEISDEESNVEFRKLKEHGLNKKIDQKSNSLKENQRESNLKNPTVIVPIIKQT
ncbi:hypothetical protein K502DRAFT_366709 [Neoconidiobolus thromboides FSU 785]|nr:hypothetical protein K502DRAFT_366709 [Neoconidiobolus thromboides FSU 785]